MALTDEDDQQYLGKVDELETRLQANMVALKDGLNQSETKLFSDLESVVSRMMSEMRKLASPDNNLQTVEALLALEMELGSLQNRVQEIEDEP